MYGKIQKWGNSQAIRLPKTILDFADFHENDDVEISATNGEIIIKQIKKHKTLKDRVSEYSGDYKCNEWNTGESTGGEEF